MANKGKDYFSGQSAAAVQFLSQKPPQGSKDAEIVIRVQRYGFSSLFLFLPLTGSLVGSGERVFVEYLVAPVGEVHASTVELLKEVAKARKRADPHKKPPGALTRFTSSLVKPTSPKTEQIGTTLRMGSSSPSIRNMQERKKTLPTHGTLGRPAHPVFGAALNSVMARERVSHAASARHVPRVVREGVSYILRRGLAVEGIFRLSGAKGEVDALRQAYDHDLEHDINSVRDPNVVASLLKLYLRELSQPLLPYKDYDLYMAAVQLHSDEETVKALHALLKSGVSGASLAVLSEFVRLLHCVAKNSKFNKMVVSNCSIVLGPNILRREDVDMSDVRQSAALAMDTQDVNRVAEFLINHPTLVTDLEPKLASNAHQPVAKFSTKLIGHPKSVLSLCAIGEAPVLVASVDSSGCVCIWDAERQEHLRSMEIGWRPIGCFGALENVWVYGQKGVEVRNVNGDIVWERKNFPFFCGIFVPNTGHVWLGASQSVVVVDAVSFELVGKAELECELLFSMCFVPGLEEVWGGGLDNSLCIYDANDFTLKETIRNAQKKRVNGMQVGAEGAVVLSAGEDGILTMWSTESRQVLHSIAAHEARCNSVLVASNGTIWTAAWDTTIKVFDGVHELELLDTQTGIHDDAIFGLIQVGDYVWSSSGDKSLAVWKIVNQ